MRKSILLLLFAFLTTAAMAQVNFFEGSTAEALERGKAETKEVIIMYTNLGGG